MSNHTDHNSKIVGSTMRFIYTQKNKTFKLELLSIVRERKSYNEAYLDYKPAWYVKMDLRDWQMFILLQIPPKE